MRLCSVFAIHHLVKLVATPRPFAKGVFNPETESLVAGMLNDEIDAWPIIEGFLAGAWLNVQRFLDEPKQSMFLSVAPEYRAATYSA